MMYTSLHLHVINIYIFKLLYTCINLVYTIVYACIQCIEDKSQYNTWYIRVYTKYMIGLRSFACIQCIEDKSQYNTWYIRVYTKYMIGLFSML